MSKQPGTSTKSAGQRKAQSDLPEAWAAWLPNEAPLVEIRKGGHQSTCRVQSS